MPRICRPSLIIRLASVRGGKALPLPRRPSDRTTRTPARVTANCTTPPSPRRQRSPSDSGCSLTNCAPRSAPCPFSGSFATSCVPRIAQRFPSKRTPASRRAPSAIPGRSAPEAGALSHAARPPRARHHHRDAPVRSSAIVSDSDARTVHSRESASSSAPTSSGAPYNPARFTSAETYQGSPPRASRYACAAASS